jgi:hypothetical protein
MPLSYVISATGQVFHECDSFVKLIVGPYGSGKSCASVDLLTYACAQAPAVDGTRYTRVGIIRSTFPELVSTTRRSLMDVLPSDCGYITTVGSPLKGLYSIPLPDNTRVQVELELIAMRTPDDCEKIKSANWSFAFINEVTGICPDVFAMVQSRIGRYPSIDMGGVSWGGIIMDSNMIYSALYLKARLGMNDDARKKALQHDHRLQSLNALAIIPLTPRQQLVAFQEELAALVSCPKLTEQ